MSDIVFESSTYEEWSCDDGDYTSKFSFSGTIDGKPFSLEVPVGFSTSVEGDSDGESCWNYVKVLVQDGLLETGGYTLTIDGQDCSNIPALVETFSTKQFGDQWDFLADSLAADFRDSDDAKEILSDAADEAEEARDPYGYRGLSRRDFL